MELSQFSSSLLEWYWNHGNTRKGRYFLSPSTWLSTLYDIKTKASSCNLSLSRTRPAMAIWGPSQTGKSTSVSLEIDANAEFTGDATTDGSRSGLHFAGGKPAFFVNPNTTKNASIPLNPQVSVLNPFRSGADASACVSRFTLMSGPADLAHPLYPIQVKLGTFRELKHAIACGYRSQCYGSEGTGRYHSNWTPEKFHQYVDDLQAQYAAQAGTTVSRGAFETTLEVYGIMDDLIFARMPEFGRLESEWDSIRVRMLEVFPEFRNVSGNYPNVLVTSDAAATAFARKMLWDDVSVINKYISKFEKVMANLSRLWKGKPVYASIDVAALFLDMESFSVSIMNQSPAVEELRDRRIYEIVPQLRWKDHGSFVSLGIEASDGNRLFERKEEFGVLQSLVWELIIPLNQGNLNRGPFMEMMETTDLLDFPGIEKGNTAAGNRIDLDKLASMDGMVGVAEVPGVDEDNKESVPVKFFNRLVKRGKTSSIVQNYTRQMTIDGFSIFQDIDNAKGNPAELVTGIKTWWRSCIPDYFADQSGKSPLPLNFALTFWGKFFNEEHSWKTTEGDKLRDHDVIKNPSIATSLALNYFKFKGRGMLVPETEAKLSTLVARLWADETFVRRFGSDPDSKASFENMLADRERGGALFFFGLVKRQMSSAGLLKTKARDLQAKLEKDALSLLRWPDLLPPSEKLEDRRPLIIKALQERLYRTAERAAGPWMKEASRCLRQLFNVEQNRLSPLPPDVHSITESTVENYFYEWQTLQTASFDAWKKSEEQKSESCWHILEYPNSDALREFLEAVVNSIRSDFAATTTWLYKLIDHSNRRQVEDGQRRDMREYVAVKMSNLLMGYDEQQDNTAPDLPSGDLTPTQKLTGYHNPYYRNVLHAIIGPSGRLIQLANRQTDPNFRPDQPGDNEIAALVSSLKL